MSAADPKNIFVEVEGENQGPFTAQELQFLINDNQLPAAAPAAREGSAEWKTAGHLAKGATVKESSQVRRPAKILERKEVFGWGMLCHFAALLALILVTAPIASAGFWAGAFLGAGGASADARMTFVIAGLICGLVFGLLPAISLYKIGSRLTKYHICGECRKKVDSAALCCPWCNIRLAR